MIGEKLSVFAYTVLLAMSTSATAVEVDMEFSAEAVQIAPERQPMKTQIYVSKQAVRTESDVNNQKYIEIVFPKEGRRVMLMPQQKAYMEQRGMPAESPVMAGKKGVSPCEGVPNTSCRKLGMEKISGRQAEKWEISTQRDGRTVRSLHWIDVERRTPLREMFSDGTIAELKILGKEEVNGRSTEKWQLTVTGSDSQSKQSLQWFDPALKIAIREELPGGYVRELKNIKVAKQPQDLFTIPAGYQRMEAPVQRGYGGGVPQR